MLCVVCCNRFSGRRQPARIRLVVQCSWFVQGSKNRGFIVGESHLGRIRGGKIEEFSSGLLRPLKRHTEAVRREVPVSAAGEHKKALYRSLRVAANLPYLDDALAA